MVCRVAKKADMPALVRLWQQTFGDEEAFVLDCLQNFCGLSHVYIADESGTPVAMLLAVPCQAGGLRGIYLYALATQAAMRGRGVMSQLMDFAEKQCAGQGALFSALIPANAGLFPFYQKRGYYKIMRLRYLTLEPLEMSQSMRDAAKRLPVDIGRLRTGQNTVNAVTFEGERAAFVNRDLAESGAIFVRGAKAGQACAVALPDGPRLLVPELWAADDAAALGLLWWAALVAGTSQIHLSLAEENTLFLGQGTLHSFAVAKSLQPEKGRKTLPPNLYLRLALEEIAAGFAQQNNG